MQFMNLPALQACLASAPSAWSARQHGKLAQCASFRGWGRCRHPCRALWTTGEHRHWGSDFSAKHTLISCAPCHCTGPSKAGQQ